MKSRNHRIPTHHFDSLKKIEAGYWWYEGRVIWARRLIHDWLRKNGLKDVNCYADLGCGTGGLGSSIHQQFRCKQTFLVDNNPEALNRVPSAEGVQLINLDLQTNFKLPIEPNLITCMDVVEHIENDEKFLNELFAQLKPDGMLILSTAAHPFLFSNWDRALGHYRRYSKDFLIKKLEEAGFEVKSASYGWSFLFPAAPYRFLFAKHQEKLDYPKVPAWLNLGLIKLAELESATSSWVNFPFGTSIFVSALKPTS